MLYTKEMLEAARFAVVGSPDTLEQAYINGWNDALEAVINNYGQERKTGHWINHYVEYSPGDSTIECSECHEEQLIGGDDNYCPYCGAEMTDERPEDKG